MKKLTKLVKINNKHSSAMEKNKQELRSINTERNQSGVSSVLISRLEKVRKERIKSKNRCLNHIIIFISLHGYAAAGTIISLDRENYPAAIMHTFISLTMLILALANRKILSAKFR